jgi:hypothetical protein
MDEHEGDRWLGGEYFETERRKERIIVPTVYRIPLERGASFQKKYAPFFVVQRFNNPEQLMQKFFQQADYLENAMYVSIYAGEQDDFDKYTALLGSLRFVGTNGAFNLSSDATARQLQPPCTLLYNCHLNSPGVDRGGTMFGGFGPGTTYLSDGTTFLSRPFLLLNAIRFGTALNQHEPIPGYDFT